MIRHFIASSEFAPSDRRIAMSVRKAAATFPRCSSFSHAFAGATLLALLACDRGYAQSQVFCNKNNTNNTISLLMQQAGACSTGNTVASKANDLKQNQQAVGNAIEGVFQIWSIFHPPKDVGNADQRDPEAEAEAAAAAKQLRINAEASDLLQQANGLADSLNNSSPDSASGPNASSAVNSLLDSPPSSDSSSSAINALLDDNTAPDPSANQTATAVAGLLDQPTTPPETDSVSNAQFVAVATQRQDPPPTAEQTAAFDDDLFGDKRVTITGSDFLRGMKKTGSAWVNSAGDLLNSHPLQSLANAMGLTPNPNADAVDAIAHSCGLAMLAGAAPNPMGGDAAAAGCGKAASMAVIGMVNDETGQQ
jgi:hypothetical protein